jgi:hypothetical protein
MVGFSSFGKAMSIVKAARIVASVALALGWFVPAWLAFSEILDGMGRRRPFSADEWAYVLACVHVARAWFILAAGVAVVLAVRAVVHRRVAEGAADGRMA